MPIGAAVMAASYIRITGMCFGRAYAELKNSICPENALMDVRTAKRSDIHHRRVFWKGICGTIIRGKLWNSDPVLIFTTEK